MSKVRYFSRYEGLTDYSVVMRDDEGFESVVSTARSRERADIKAEKLQAKEDRLSARARSSAVSA